MITLYTEEHGPVIIIHIEGILTRETLKDAEDLWNEQMDKHPEVIAFDVTALSQIDSVSINHVFKLSMTAAKKNIKLFILDTNESLKKLFEVVKLNKIIPIIPKQRFETDYLNNR
jgi:anti-anti-sigma factor